jgi:hypothetical protein
VKKVSFNSGRSGTRDVFFRLHPLAIVFNYSMLCKRDSEEGEPGRNSVSNG